VVLVGKETAQRPWVDYEIRKAWNDGLGVVGIRIHGLKGFTEQTTIAGLNPFESIALKSGAKLSSKVSLINPTGANSKEVYNTIVNNIEPWVEEAIKNRKS
jgi:hypothetical protein